MTKRKDNSAAFDALLAKDAPAPKPVVAAPVAVEPKTATLTPAHLSQLVDVLTTVGSAVTAMQRQMAEAKTQSTAPQKPTPDNSAAIIAALGSLRQDLNAGLRQLAELSAADRILLEDESGSRSRIAR